MYHKTNENCKNCRFYVPHYIKIRAGFSKTQGHCMNDCVNKKTFNKRFIGSEPCEFWQSNELQKQAERQDVVKALCKMSENLEQIRQILEDAD